MAINAQWGNENQEYIIVTFRNEWTWNELHALESGDLSAMLQQSPSVPLLMDMRLGVWIRPPDLQREIMRSGQVHSQFGVSMVVFTLMDVAIGTLLVQMHSRYAGTNSDYVHAQDMNEALALIDAGLATRR